jgi:hypothetical protein
MKINLLTRKNMKQLVELSVKYVIIAGVKIYLN